MDPLVRLFKLIKTHTILDNLILNKTRVYHDNKSNCVTFDGQIYLI